jgi:ferritin-like metal-binding protein YciE
MTGRKLLAVLLHPRHFLISKNVTSAARLNTTIDKEQRMSLDNLADAFYDELCDIYHAEKQLLKAIPKMAKKATNDKLVEALTTHLDETKQQVERVEAAFEDTGKSAKAKKCEAMAGLIKEAQEMMEEEADPEVMDAVIIGLAQKVEHYEIATYGTLCSWAESLGYTNAKEQLGENLAEEENADKTLTKVSKSVNQVAETVDK